MHIGYCRVSTGKQAASIEAQEAQLKKAGCGIVYKDENESGGKRNRPQLNKHWSTSEKATCWLSASWIACPGR
jgi:DNA invertase Pin-like site-specific DNA recombinase